MHFAEASHPINNIFQHISSKTAVGEWYISITVLITWDWWRRRKGSRVGMSNGLLNLYLHQVMKDKYPAIFCSWLNRGWFYEKTDDWMAINTYPHTNSRTCVYTRTVLLTHSLVQKQTNMFVSVQCGVCPFSKDIWNIKGFTVKRP